MEDAHGSVQGSFEPTYIQCRRVVIVNALIADRCIIALGDEVDLLAYLVELCVLHNNNDTNMLDHVVDL